MHESIQDLTESGNESKRKTYAIIGSMAFLTRSRYEGVKLIEWIVKKHSIQTSRHENVRFVKIGSWTEIVLDFKIS